MRTMPEPLQADSEFARVLRAAIQARGLGLERIRDRLRVQGISVSLATLSYWQSGRSRPGDGIRWRPFSCWRPSWRYRPGR